MGSHGHPRQVTRAAHGHRGHRDCNRLLRSESAIGSHLLSSVPAVAFGIDAWPLFSPGMDRMPRGTLPSTFDCPAFLGRDTAPARGKCPRLVRLVPSSIRSEASVPVWLGWCRRRSGPMAYTPLDARAILAPTPNGSFTSGLPPIARLPIARLLARPRLWTSRPRPYASALDDSRAGRPYVYASLRIPRRVLRTGRAGRPAIGLRRSGRHPPPTNTHERCTSHNAAERNPGCHASPLGDCHPRSHGIKESAGNPDWVASAPVPGPPPPPLSARWGFMQVCPFWLARHTPRSRFNPLNCAHDISRPVSALPLAQSHHTEDSTI